MWKKLSALALGLVLCAPAFSYVVVERPVMVQKTYVVRERPVVVNRSVIVTRPVMVARRPVVVNRVVYVTPYRNTYYRYPRYYGYWY